MSTPFKMKGITPLKHTIGKHPSKKDGHVRADHKKRKEEKKRKKELKKYARKTGKSTAESLKFIAGDYRFRNE